MGFVVGAVAASASFAIAFVGRASALEPALVLALQFVCWVAGLMPVAQGGHRTFKTGVNTDLVAYALVLGIYVSASVSGLGRP